jgi:pilus assembly protein CpaE
MYPLAAGLVIGSKDLADDLRRSLDLHSVRVLFEVPEIPEDWSDFLDRIERVAPDLLLLETTSLRWPLEEVVQRIQGTAAKPAVFALQRTPEAEAILAVLRAGAAEFLYPPFGDSLKAALERLAIRREQNPGGRKASGKIVAFLSAKGGCGATTVASHVAVNLLRHAAGKTLLADLDLQSGVIGFLFKATSPYTIADAAGNLQRLDKSYWKALVSNGIPGLEIIGAPAAPSSKNIEPAQAVQVLAFARTQYEWTVLDLGRNLTPFTLSMLEMADQTFLVTTNEIPALHETKKILQTLLAAGYARTHLHLILNRTPKHAEITMQELEGMLGAPVYASLPNDYQGLQEAYANGRMLDSKSILEKHFSRLAARIAGVKEPKKKTFSLFGREA